tara:strand:- start:356 stop:616 length:261 start_codon:yes stop_codon:yes gene_type:complete
MKRKFYNYLQNLQDSITSKIEKIDGKSTFKEDLWSHHENGGGRTRVISDGSIFEKGGVNISSITGTYLRLCNPNLKLKIKTFLLVD